MHREFHGLLRFTVATPSPRGGSVSRTGVPRVSLRPPVATVPCPPGAVLLAPQVSLRSTRGYSLPPLGRFVVCIESFTRSASTSPLAAARLSGRSVVRSKSSTRSASLHPWLQPSPLRGGLSCTSRVPRFRFTSPVATALRPFGAGLAHATGVPRVLFRCSIDYFTPPLRRVELRSIEHVFLVELDAVSAEDPQ